MAANKTQHETKPYRCYFIPPYVLNAINNSPNVAEVCRTACQCSLTAIHDCHEDRKTHAHVHVSTQPASSGFVAPYTLSAIAYSDKAPVEAKEAAQQTLTATTLAPTLQRKIYDCKSGNRLPGTIVRSEGQSRIKDRSINNCYDGFGITYNFYKEAFGRNSLDNRGLPLTASCHFQPSGESAGFNNAYWDSSKSQMVFGDGDGIMFDYLTDSLDVIAHELTHGFVQYSSQLEYYNQSGALNESVADVFACMAEQWHIGQTVDRADWLLGQTLFPVAVRGSALRSLREDKAYENDPILGTDPQPKHMKNLYKGREDGGGVHINSGIPNHAFYLAAKAVGGYSWERVGKVWYETMLSGKIPPTCDFKTFATVTVGAAEKLFSTDESVAKAVKDAWIKVGVLE